MDARVFQEAIRSATVTYPIPFIFGVLLLFALLSLGGSILVSDGLRILFASLGTISFLGALALVAYAVRSRSDLLRSERYSVATRLLDILDDSEDQSMRAALAKTIDGYMEENIPKKVSQRKGATSDTKGDG